MGTEGDLADEDLVAGSRGRRAGRHHGRQRGAGRHPVLADQKDVGMPTAITNLWIAVSGWSSHTRRGDAGHPDLRGSQPPTAAGPSSPTATTLWSAGRAVP